MTLQEIQNSSAMFINANDVADILHIAPQNIRRQAREHQLPFATMTSGNRVYVLRQSFLDYIGG